MTRVIQPRVFRVCGRNRDHEIPAETPEDWNYRQRRTIVQLALQAQRRPPERRPADGLQLYHQQTLEDEL